MVVNIAENKLEEKLNDNLNIGPTGVHPLCFGMKVW